MYERILAGTDLSPTAEVATDRAAAIASRLVAELILVHVGTDPGEPLAKLGAEYGAQVVVVPGNPAEALIKQCEEQGADLLVVGSVGMSGARRFMLGNVPNKVSHHAGTDLLIVKTDPIPAEVSDYQRVLVGTDGSPTATRAVDMASDLAKRLGITPVIVCAYEPLTEQELDQLKSDSGDAIAQWTSGQKVTSVPEEFRWRIAGAAQAEDVLDRAAQHAAERGIDAEVRAIEGHPADALLSLAEAEGFDLIVLGSVGMTGAKRFMLGNVPHRISHHAPTDVLILHTT